MQKKYLLPAVAGLALVLSACGQAAAPEPTTRMVRGVVRNDYAQTREGKEVDLGTFYVADIEENITTRRKEGGFLGIGETEKAYVSTAKNSYRFPIDRAGAERLASMIINGDRIVFEETGPGVGNPDTIRVTQPSDGIEIPQGIPLRVARYEKDLMRDLHTLRIEDGMAVFDVYPVIPNASGEIIYTIKVPFQTEGRLEDIKRNLTQYSGVQILRGGELVQRNSPRPIPGRPAVGPAVTAVRTAKGLDIYVDPDFLGFVDARQYYVETPFNVPSGRISRDGVREPVFDP